MPALAQAGIRFSDWSSLDDDDREHLVEVFQRQIYPVLTPLAVDPGHPFPYISNLSLNLVVEVQDPSSGEGRIARVKVPPTLPRFVVMPDGERFVPLEQVISAHLDSLFPGMTIGHHHVFRVTRNADLALEEDEADDLLVAIEMELRRRRFGKALRLEVEADMGQDLADLLADRARDRARRRLPGLRPARPERAVGCLRPGPSRPARRDLDADDVAPPGHGGARPGRVLRAAARARRAGAPPLRLVRHLGRGLRRRRRRRTPRCSGSSRPSTGPAATARSWRSLIQAAENGKQVAAIVELKARFDEEANIGWARALEEVGVHVVYGIVGLKTHSKTALVLRKEDDGVRPYCHVGTGNYNSKTARIYEDIGLLTSDPDIGADVGELFNYLTGFSKHADYRQILVSPVTVRKRIKAMIEEQAEAGPSGRIVMKLNGLTDAEMIDALYRASGAGVEIDLAVRGLCRLRPGIPELSRADPRPFHRGQLPRAFEDLPLRRPAGRPGGRTRSAPQALHRLGGPHGAQPGPPDRGRRPGARPRAPGAPLRGAGPGLRGRDQRLGARPGPALAPRAQPAWPELAGAAQGAGAGAVPSPSRLGPPRRRG